MNKLHEIKLQSGYTYHFYSQGNNREKVFKEKQNYSYFLKKFSEKITPIANVFAFCLMPNHFHFLFQIKPYWELHLAYPFYFSPPLLARVADEITTQEELEYDVEITQNIWKVVGKFLGGYTRAINNRYKRTGKLWRPTFGRKLVLDESYFEYLICYIHRNPLHHGYCQDWSEWSFSSYDFLLQSFRESKDDAGFPYMKEIVNADFVRKWFGNRANFLKAHEDSLIGLDKTFFLE